MMLLLIPSPGVGTRSRSLPLRPQRRQDSPSCQDDAPPRARRLGCCERLPPEPSSLFLLHANDLKATTTRYTLPFQCGLALIVLLPLQMDIGPAADPFARGAALDQATRRFGDWRIVSRSAWSVASASRLARSTASRSCWLCFTRLRVASRAACALRRTSTGSIAQP